MACGSRTTILACSCGSSVTCVILGAASGACFTALLCAMWAINHSIAGVSHGRESLPPLGWQVISTDAGRWLYPYRFCGWVWRRLVAVKHIDLWPTLDATAGTCGVKLVASGPPGGMPDLRSSALSPGHEPRCGQLRRLAAVHGSFDAVFGPAARGCPGHSLITMAGCRLLACGSARHFWPAPVVAP